MSIFQCALGTVNFSLLLCCCQVFTAIVPFTREKFSEHSCFVNFSDLILSIFHRCQVFSPLSTFHCNHFNKIETKHSGQTTNHNTKSQQQKQIKKEPRSSQTETPRWIPFLPVSPAMEGKLGLLSSSLSALESVIIIVALLSWSRLKISMISSQEGLSSSIPVLLGTPSALVTKKMPLCRCTLSGMKIFQPKSSVKFSTISKKLFQRLPR